MDFVDEDNLAVPLSELVLGVHQDEPLLGSNLRPSLEQSPCVPFHHLVVLLADDALADDFLARDVLVVSLVGLGGRGYDGFGEPLVLPHALGKPHAAQLAASVLVLSPCRARQVAADNHLHAEALSLEPHGHHRVGGCQFPVGHYVGRSVEEACGNLVEALSLEWYALGQNDVESRDTVCGHHHHDVVVDVVHVTDFAVVDAHLSGQVEVGSCQCSHIYIICYGLVLY